MAARVFVVWVSVVYFILQLSAQGYGDDVLPLWEEQMKEVNRILKSEGYFLGDEDRATASTRMAGTTYFNITFDGTPTEYNVHSLRPQDIDIVGAMGDSLTAANGAGAHTVPGIAFQYRGQCFSMGGDNTVETTITVPNILKKFNDQIYGYSVGTDLGGSRPAHGFNVAVPGARADDMYGQAVRLVQDMKNDNNVDFEADWKVVTLFIGGNDLCALGRDPTGASAEAYTAEIKRALDYLHTTAEMPRVFINIVDILEIYLLPLVGYGAGSTVQCRFMQNSFCGYIIGADGEEREYIEKVNKEYQTFLKDLIDSGIYDARDDFTVVIQPFLRDSVLPYTSDGRVDASYFAPDCFHFSDIGHAMGGLNLWNNMMEPVGQKSTEWSLSNIKVPTKSNPYLFTSKNSDVVFEQNDVAEAAAEECPTSPPEKHEWEIATISVLGAMFLVEIVGIFSVM